MFKWFDRWLDSLGGPIRLLNEDYTVHEEARKAGGAVFLEAILMSEALLFPGALNKKEGVE